ncbi:YoaK family protein [Crocinitomix algicola]|uniref:YoaK family protein n=1 Tax=Crocinitomix algicola TaxID=1740263 RepID=UPI0008362E4D|nr:YoaK family protein [Crocinitomix algicola]
MLRKFNNYRTHQDNLKIAILTACSAGMVNVLSVILFFAFTSNVTGHYAILAQEVAKGNWYQAAIVFIWISLFLIGNFTSNMLIIHSKPGKSTYLAHATPLILEIICLLTVSIYLQRFYLNTLWETEFLVALMLFAMGLQNGLTASITNFSIKTTHLTGLTTDLGLLFSMFTKKKYRKDKKLRRKAQILLSVVTAYMFGGISAGILHIKVGYAAFYIVCVLLGIILFYDYSVLKIKRRKRSLFTRKNILFSKKTL